MFPDVPWLSLLIFLPSLGALVLFSIRGSADHVASNARWVALWASFITFCVTVYITISFDPTLSNFQFVEQADWLSVIRVQYLLGIDGISLPFIFLTTFLTMNSILISWDSIQENVREYMALFLLLESFLIGMFCATDLMLFYIFFEAILIPLFLIIGIWGGRRRIYATFKFFFYTLTGSVFLLVAIIYIYHQVGTLEILQIASYHFSLIQQKWLWGAFFIAFAVKLPLWPFHTWLPDAHVEAPSAGSVILASILLKAGGYGFLRFVLPFFPSASVFFMPLIGLLGVISILYASCLAFVQRDIKKLIAYSSIAHMGFVVLGLFTFTLQGLQGAIFQMISHGLISGGLFLCVGIIYERFHTRDIALLGGIVQKMPLFSIALMILVLGTIGMPGTMGFVGELLVILGTFQVAPIYAGLTVLGIILSALYGFRFYRKVIFGSSSHDFSGLHDLNSREFWILTPLVLCVIMAGLLPNPFLQITQPAIKNILATIEKKSLSHTSNDCQTYLKPPFPHMGDHAP